MATIQEPRTWTSCHPALKALVTKEVKVTYIDTNTEKIKSIHIIKLTTICPAQLTINSNRTSLVLENPQWRTLEMAVILHVHVRYCPPLIIRWITVQDTTNLQITSQIHPISIIVMNLKGILKVDLTWKSRG